MKEITINGKSIKSYTLNELEKTLKKQIAANDVKAIHAMEVIYNFQTSEEKNKECTIEDNGIGFSGIDSTIMSNLAEYYKCKGYLSQKQMAIVKRIMPRYAGQLLRNSIGLGKIEKISRGNYIIVK